MNLSYLVADRADKYEDKVFLLFERQAVPGGADIALASFRHTMTFRELDDHVNQACHYLSGLGLSRGDVFNLHLPNCLSFIILWFAAARLGAVMMPTNVLSSAAELAYLLDHSNSTVSFTTADHLVTLRQC